jgi:hypothetical protein
LTTSRYSELRAARSPAAKEAGKPLYESYFVRANHPSEDKALWVRYTTYLPKSGAPEAELWAMLFDGERVVAGKNEIPFGEAEFDATQMAVTMPQGKLSDGHCEGHTEHKGQNLNWDLQWDAQPDPVLMFKRPWYDRGFPKAKSLVLEPNVILNGTFGIEGQEWQIDGWRGSINHNWGSKHTDAYAWGQVCGFAEKPDWLLEIATARIKLGPVWTPWFAPIALKTSDGLIEFNGMLESVRNEGTYRPFHWTVKAQNDQYAFEALIECPVSKAVALWYRNPPGGGKYCLNSKTASATCKLTDKKTGEVQNLTSQSAAFEILSPEVPAGMEVAV